MSQTLGSSVAPANLIRLTGGLECETYAFRAMQRRFVVKVYLHNGEGAMTEFENLAIVASAGVPTPDPVLLDAHGEWFHVPALVMTAVPGGPDLHPADLHRWHHGAATALAAIHDVAPDRASVVRPTRWERWRPSTEAVGTDTSRVDRALSRFYDQAGDVPTVFSHDDYNLGNILFHNGRLSGVVDWADVTVEPRHAAVALYRHLLAVHPGGDAPDQFLEEYERAAATRLEDLPLWDVFYGLRGTGTVDHWARAFDGLGVHVTPSQIQARSRDWIRRALSHLSM